ncbi:MAG: TetR/AcrR family transcriptional regulator [Geminicoccaceae bacterium]
MSYQRYSGTAADILDAAERRMRRGGYEAVSFRDIAGDAGIKSASVHYHFPQKADLAVALIERYGSRFLTGLRSADSSGESSSARIERLCRAYETAFVDDGLPCLCCVLGAESRDLPDPVADAIRSFFEQLLAWTENALSPAPRKDRLGAAQIVAGLQGAMILAIATGRPEIVAQTSNRILAQLRS